MIRKIAQLFQITLFVTTCIFSDVTPSEGLNTQIYRREVKVSVQAHTLFTILLAPVSHIGCFTAQFLDISFHYDFLRLQIRTKEQVVKRFIDQRSRRAYLCPSNKHHYSGEDDVLA